MSFRKKLIHFRKNSLFCWVLHRLSSVQFSCSFLSDSLRPHRLQRARLSCPSPTPGICSDSSLSSQWCHPTISYSVTPFSFCLQTFPASQCFPMSQFFVSGGQSIGFSASASILSMNIQDWFPLGLTGLFIRFVYIVRGHRLAVKSRTELRCSLQSKGLSRVFSNTTVQKHQFFGAQLSL